ncbi:glycoside hydrolase family 16 protein [Xylaria sp. CBS 124048]|nr:glycoside hydrolase family 16 protein [Xylaria sp. CBS 124048]
MPSTKGLTHLSGMLALALAAGARAQYSAAPQVTFTLQDTYNASNFFQDFQFFTGPDPTNGFVQYADAATANANGLAGFANNGIYLGVDYKTLNPPAGRASVRLTSSKSYTHALIIADIAHQPASVCGSWPAFWTFGPAWPTSGEIDIIEGVNRQTNGTVTLHSSPGCSFSSSSFASGDCGAPGDGTIGCGNPTQNTRTFGDGFNAIGGGIYAVLWTSDAIQVYFFPRTGRIPSDITSGQPNPSSWGQPLSSFSGGSCDIDSHFKNHYLVFDTTFCGSFAGGLFSSDPVCAAKASTCEAYVGGNPGDFANSYWLINSVKVFSVNTAKRGINFSA